MYDSRLPFRSSLSCTVFQAISNSIVRMLGRHGFDVVGYLDDFMLVARNESECAAGLKCLVEVVTNLGLCVNWDKAAQPSQKLPFLGVSIDCVARTISLPEDKLCEIIYLINNK